MSYPGPPGTSSLPPRPPPVKSTGFKPAFSQAPPGFAPGTAPSYSGAPGTSPSYPSAPGYGAPGTTPGSYGAPPGTSAASYAASYSQPAAVSAPGYGQSYNASYPQSSYPSQRGGYYGVSNTNDRFSNPPQIRNPFPAPAPAQPQQPQAPANSSDFDPEMAAQIAQWQSAYMPKGSTADQSAKGPGCRAGAAQAGTYGPTAAGPDGGAYGPAAATAGAIGAALPTAATAATANSNEKKKTVYREGGGKKWQDDTLLEWDPAHLRLFVGNLAGETTDESLLKAFASWKSVQKAKVIRDKRTKKSKGFGFVSFSDPDDFFHAARDMNGKYIQSHPVVVHKAKTEVKATNVKEDKRGGKHHHNKDHKKSGGGGNKSGNGMGGDGGGPAGYEPRLGPMGGGVTKPGQKTKGGLKLLG